MVELQVLALASLPARMLQSRFGWVSARRAIAAEPTQLFEFLSEIENHWRLAEGFLEALPSEGFTGDRQVRLRGPLGLRRDARTSVVFSLAPRLMVGRATVGRRTIAEINWVLSRGRPGSTDVQLSAKVERVGALDGLVLLLGGRGWLERRFEAVLRVFAELAASPGEEGGFQTGESHSEPIRREVA